jgi:hypothetical protein
MSTEHTPGFPKLYEAVEDTHRGVSSDRPALRIDGGNNDGRMLATITLSGYKLGEERSPRSWAKRLKLAHNCHDDLVAALEEAVGWLEEYSVQNYAKAKTAPDGREQGAREYKGKINADRAAKLRAALTKAKALTGKE